MDVTAAVENLLGSNNVRVTIATGTPLDVREFSIDQAMSRLFRVEIVAVSTELNLDLEGVIGLDASCSVTQTNATASLSGICLECEQIRVEATGLATYRLVIVPALWKLTQRTNYRIFQFLSELDIVKKLLQEWGIRFELRTNAGLHKPRKYRVQYGESDFDFVSRMLEDAGISYYFEDGDGGTTLVLDDAPETRDVTEPGVRFHDEPGVTDLRFATRLATRSRLRPGAMTVGDVDYRLPSTKQPRLGTVGGLPQESKLEQFDFEPGAFLYQGGGSAGTPFADDRGASRTDQGAGNQKVANRLAGHRNDARIVGFESNVIGLAPGRILSIVDHPHSMTAGSLLVVRTSMSGEHSSQWRVVVDAAPTSQPYRPALSTPKPRVQGIESATVVGPKAEEIHTDEFGRVRVHFHWDRESQRNQESSCWLPTNQPWAGDGYGGVNLPRVGQEVLVGFLGGDPDRPVVTGRVYTETNPVPDPLPKYKHVSGLFSESTPRMVMGGSIGDFTMGNEGPYGGTPMTPAEMDGNATIGGPTQVVSPTGTNHRWKGSGMKLDDMSGAENLYIQANKDMHWLVQHDWKTVVGAHRTAKTGTDDATWVEKNQQIFIGSDQSTTIGQSQQIHVYGERIDVVGDKFLQTVKKNWGIASSNEGIVIHAEKDITFDAKTNIEFRVGASVVKIQKSMITATSEKNSVHLNPSQPADTPEQAKERRIRKAVDTLNHDLWFWQRPSQGNDQTARDKMAENGTTDRGEQDAALKQYYDKQAADQAAYEKALADNPYYGMPM